MYSHQLEKMAELVAAKLAAKPLKTKKAICKAVLATLQDYWNDKIAIMWEVGDVHSIHAGLTDEQAMEVLREVNRNHDAENGVNWDTLRYEAEEQFGEAPEEEEEGDFELIAEFKDRSTASVQKELADKTLAWTETDDLLRKVELKDDIHALERVLELRENELPEKESDEETSLEFLGPQEPGPTDG